jgi:hypothetical protein
VLWLALAPALAWPGVTEALPDADPLADVCATAPAASRHAALAAIQNLFMIQFLSFLIEISTIGSSKNRGLTK